MKTVCVSVVCGLVLAGGAALADHHGGHSLVGAWDWDNGWTATFKEDGHLIGAADNVAMNVLTWSLDGDRLTIRDLSPPPGVPDFDCALENDGIYSVEWGDGTVTLTVEDDPCSGRAAAFGGHTLTWRDMPEMDVPD
ncbi:hypothetical protein [Maricaulis sp. CAU 1757]